MVFFIIIGLLGILVDVLFLIFPAPLRSLNEVGMRVTTSIDNAMFRYCLGFGLSLVIARLLFFFYISVRG